MIQEINKGGFSILDPLSAAQFLVVAPDLPEIDTRGPSTRVDGGLNGGYCSHP